MKFKILPSSKDVYEPVYWVKQFTDDYKAHFSWENTLTGLTLFIILDINDEYATIFKLKWNHLFVHE